ncbi:hypothetical protein ATN88_19200 [Enterovibrio coralii]|uniref:OmpA-like domain-containing protein n=2 Tax=Enterovibrio coralii TaxID=294935 RepID=A0A135I6L3_9GAMM|nr:hypothetical protein ATN88_19200 [Enterovibrio coralii]
MGIDKAMLEVRAHGERYPIASNENAEGRQKNRRVTLRLVMDTDRVTSEADKANTTKTTTNETAKVQK